MYQTAGLHRISVAEYGDPENVAEHALRMNIPAETLEHYLTQVSQRISTALRVEEPIILSKGLFRVIDVAGLIKLAPNIELEVRPKFLGPDVASWREDFFAIATIARYGRVFPQEALRSTAAEKGDLADLLGRAVISMYDRNYRRLLRTYRQASWQDFNIDGEVEPESLLLPDNDGFRQSGIVLDQQNQYNAVIHQAMGHLLIEIRNGDTRRQLHQRQLRLAPQRAVSRLPARRQLPSRHRRWQELYDLSRHIIEGFGIGYADLARAVLPGYIINTDDAWESLLLMATRIGLPDRTVDKKSYTLGQRSRPGAADRAITATPDISIQRQDGSCFAVDAKYKGRVLANGREVLSIESADLYEALAFLQATATHKAILLYPLLNANDIQDSDASTQNPGETTEFERALIGNYEVVGLSVNVQGISKKDGFRRFAENVCSALKGEGA